MKEAELVVEVSILHPLLRTLRRAARQRDIHPADLVVTIVETVIAEGLIDAVLDDQVVA